jgi:hypothetical protein
VTVSEAFAVPDAPAGQGSAAAPAAAPATPRSPAWARSLLPGAGRARAALDTVAADFRRSWWMPASLPTIGQAWARRTPDRTRVPGGNGALYAGWVVFNHSVGLLVPALALALVGVVTPLVWVAGHPARLALAALVAVPLVVMILW